MTNEFTPAGSGAAPAAVAPREPRIVDAGRGTSWWGEGWRLFTPDVGVWLLIMLILIVIHVCGAFIPVVGHLALQILFPVFSGGLMLGCRALDRGNPLTVGHLFGGFSQRTGPLIVVGLIYTGLAILIMLVVAGMMIAIFGVAILGMLTGAVDPSQTGIALGSVVVAVLLGCSEGTVKSAASRGLRRLRELAGAWQEPGGGPAQNTKTELSTTMRLAEGRP